MVSSAACLLGIALAVIRLAFLQGGAM